MHLEDVPMLNELKSLTSLKVTEKGKDWSYSSHVDNKINEFNKLQVEEAGGCSSTVLFKWII
jgi:hypothetical protein